MSAVEYQRMQRPPDPWPDGSDALFFCISFVFFGLLEDNNDAEPLLVENTRPRVSVLIDRDTAGKHDILSRPGAMHFMIGL